MRLLWDADTVFHLHHELWRRPDAELHPAWLKLQANCGASPLLFDYIIG